MPFYNQNEFIEEAIQTVKHEVDELVIVDDGSKVPYEGADLFHAQNQGTAAAINLGTTLLTKHDWWTWVSSDNTYSPGWIGKLLAKTGPDVGVVYAAFTWVHTSGRRHRLFTPWKPNQLISKEACFYGPCFIIRREVWQTTGGHRGKICHDYDHWLRVEEACQNMRLRIVGLDESLCDYNAHDKRATILKAKEYDATHWRELAIQRRTEFGLTEMLP